MDVLVTGAAGFIGEVLVRSLADRGHHVHGVDRRPMGALPLDTVVEGDLTDPEVARAAVSGVDVVYHLAAARGDFGISESAYYRDNVEATQTLLEAGDEAGIRDWVFFSTVSAMGPSAEPLDETASLRPTIPYGQTKAEAERLFRRFSAAHPSARILILRPSAVYGPGNPPNTNVYRLIDAIARDRFAMVGDGDVRKTTSYLENLIAATFFLSDRLRTGVQVFIYVDRPVMTTATLVRRIHHLLGKPVPRWSVPRWLARPMASGADLLAAVTGIDLPITAARIEKFCTATNFDGGAIREEGFEQPVSNEEALRRTVRWHRDHVLSS